MLEMSEIGSNPKVSVVIPTYNRSYIITKMLSSLMMQKFRGFEVIIIDDGSTDDTEEILKPWLKKKINYIRIKHMGTPHAWNLGAKLSNHNYILFLGDDVSLHPNCIAILVEDLKKLDKKNFGAIAPRLIYVSDLDNIKEIKGYRKYPYIDPCTGDIIGSFNIEAKGLIEVPIIHGYSLVRKESFDDVGGFDEKTYGGNYFREETDLWLRFRNKGYKLYYEPRAKIYCKSGIIKGGQWSNVGANLLKYEYYVFINHYKFLKKFYGYKTILMFPSFIIRRLNFRFKEIRNYLKSKKGKVN